MYLFMFVSNMAIHSFWCD